ncbi:MAG: DUF5703 domain-containing protein [Fimbriimonadales bacterium]|nr:DUF5703 domain-containing protein [Fimbriimonadales bacterium]
MLAGVTPIAPPPRIDLWTELDRCGVVWETPSRDASGSMPLGNGEVGLNLWVEPNGDLLFLVSRTDAWSEASRLLKLGRVRVRIEPPPLQGGAPFQQRLVLKDGRCELRMGDWSLSVFVDAASPVVYVQGRGRSERSVSARVENWRTRPKRLLGTELSSSWTMQDAPEGVPVWESADRFGDRDPSAVVWWHRNETSVVPFTLRHQGLEALIGRAPDPILRRTFGGRLEGPDFARTAPTELRTAGTVRSFLLTLATASEQTDSWDEWLRRLPRPAPVDAARRRTARWWRAFWERSFVFADPPNRAGDAPSVSRAYQLQRYLLACAGRGAFPIKFNGSLFTVEPKHAGGPDLDADWRRWGDCYWWQNTRLPYFAMVASGDADLAEPLLRWFETILPLAAERTRIYYGARGAYFPETMTPFGAYANKDYGWDRTGRLPGDVDCVWWRWAWQQGLELLALMLDLHDLSGDRRFLRERLAPMARCVLDYFDSRFPRDPRGLLRIEPTQAVETYWTGVVNDTPTLAGLHAVLGRLKALPLPRDLSQTVARLLGQLPPVPMREGRLAPAERFDPQRTNVENPELYALWPFRLYGVGRPGLDLARRTFLGRIERASSGWQYDGQCAALCGLAEEAGRLLLGKVGNSHPAFRFPAMWGPNYDWLPDQCHGANVMLTLQTMLLQPVGAKIHVLPAWPKDWNVRFRLKAPKRTTVEGEWRDGRLLWVRTDPPERGKDLVLP